MKFKDLVANSLPRVRGRKSKKSAHLHSSNHVPSKQEPEFSTHAPYFMQHQHPVFESRESSVERSSTVAVVDAPWREGAEYHPTSKADRTHHAAAPCDNNSMGLITQSMTYYTPLTHQHQHRQQHQPQQQRIHSGMVMSHSADGISTQAAMLLASPPRDYVTGSKGATSLSDHYALTGYQQRPNMAATSETAVNYVGPNYVYHSQHQHQHQHHHHHHSHDYHYVYHHHHHNQDRQPYQAQTQPPTACKPDPLTERNCQQAHANAAPNPKANGNQTAAEKPQKSESGGFLRKSFASFRAMRKPGSRNKEKESRTNAHSHTQDENDKCLVCPYPQPQTVDKNGSHKKQAKQSKKELKSLMKSKKSKHNSSTHDNQSDVSWCSDNDAKIYHPSHHLHGFETVPYTNINSFPVRECSMESSISRHTVAGSREQMDQSYNFDTASLSGYDSDVTKNRSGRSRSRIKTNPWLPSPQPSLTMGRRFENRRSRDNNDDVIEDELSGCFPRSVSFDYHGQLSVSTFLSSNGQNDEQSSKRNIQRHRSLTPVDLKLNLSLPRAKKSEPPKPVAEPKSHHHMNDLNTNSTTKSRPNSILSPNSEFVALADNIEQLANNISFEYEDSFEASLERASITPGRETAPSVGHSRRRTTEETNSKKRKSDSSPPMIPNDNVSISDNAHSPDSGIGCLGSCDGDDSMTLGNTAILEQSPTVSIPSSQSTKSDSSNCTPKRKTTKPNRDSNDKNKKTSSSISTSERQNTHTETRFGTKLNKSQPASVSSQDGSRLLGSSSSESIASAVISESDIDNTSYKFVESSSNIANEPSVTSATSTMMVDPHKPQNVTPYLMVDERLDVDFRSLPRKLNGGKQAKKRAENNGSYTITRSKNVIVENECLAAVAPSMVLFPNDPSSRKGSSSSFSLSQVTKPKINVNSNHSSRGSRSLSYDKEENVGEIELKYDQFAGGREGDYEMAVNFVDLGPPTVKTTEEETSDSVAMDTVDACVQTDFLLDFDTWERKQPSGLSPLDESFDPVESTRRWLISGNMQGSADTGYSSQPRDSHVFMEEEAALLQLETLSDTDGQLGINNSSGHHSQQIKSKPNSIPSSSSYRGKLSPLDGESPSSSSFPCGCNIYCSCSANQTTTTEQNHHLRHQNHHHQQQQHQQQQSPDDCSRSQFRENQDLDDGQNAHFLECDLSRLLFGLKPPCETEFEEVDTAQNTSKADFPQVNKRHNNVGGGERSLSVSDVNKRHSSDSSTSTLTSDVVVIGDKDNDVVNYGNFSDAPFASGLSGQNNMPQSCNNNNQNNQNNNSTKESPNDDNDDDYHDYVNLPVRFFGSKNNKSKVSLPHAHKILNSYNEQSLLEENPKQDLHTTKCADCSTAQISHTSSTVHYREIISTNKHGTKNIGNANDYSFRCLEEVPTNFQGEDRPDYLEFLRDAPLQKPHSAMNQFFIVPGFGPLEFPHGTIHPDHHHNHHHHNHHKGGHSVRCLTNPTSLSIEERKSVSPKCDIKSSSRSKNTKTTKPKKEDRPSNLNLMSYNSCFSTNENTENNRSVNSADPMKKDAKGQSIPSSHVKRKPYKDSTNKTERCPTVRSYDVDDFAPINRLDLTSTATPNSTSSSSTSSSSSTASNRHDNNNTNTKSGSTRNLAERVSLLRREKEIIYRKIQEVQQQQELHRQREQFQHHRSLHSQRKEELLETLRVLKDKLEEQSKKLNMKCREEM